MNRITLSMNQFKYCKNQNLKAMKIDTNVKNSKWIETFFG